MGQDEQFGMTVEQAMQMVRMMAAELGLVEYKVPLTGGKWAYLYLPREFEVVHAERMSAWIRAMVMEEAEGEDPIVARNRKLLEAYERQEDRKQRAKKAVKPED